MASRVDRLKKLLSVQEQLKSLHETRHAGHVAAAAEAAREAAEIAERFNRDDSLSALFPEVYNNRIASALTRGEASRAAAEQELQLVATATARTNLVERNYRDARRQEEREQGDQERLEMIMNVRRPPG
ncbi:hypothetical protein [Arvimicrobium flavum]|uniref:hypothetical protein n=1 Tax=Arvimicrobium flavum TaxID=3393320 RepID=UPI00237BD466|nr:hypothetical protein [Mesorhizobium shangrilense]